MLNVICLKWGDKFSSDYVNRLFHMVNRNLSIEHAFICMTEDSTGLETGVKILPLPIDNLEFCWNKLLLFGQLPLEGTALYFDLDVVITGNLDSLLEYQPQKDFVGYLTGTDFMHPSLTPQ